MGYQVTRHSIVRSKFGRMSACGQDMYSNLCKSGIARVSGATETHVGSSGRDWGAFVVGVLNLDFFTDHSFLATSVGFHYLTEIGYIDQEIDDWFHGRNEEFVRSLEANYERSLHIDEDDTER